MVRSVRRPRSLRGRLGFTIIEILIAIVVLVLGITGIVALFPTAIESGNKTVEDTYAATICQSVVDAVSVGLRESRYTWRATLASGASFETTWTYFIFNHDGVVDKAPQAPQDFENGGSAPADQIWNKDYCIILPQSTTANNTVSANEPMFVYPVPSIPSASDPWLDVEQRSPTNLKTGSLVRNFDGNFQRFTGDGTAVVWFTRVFHLGVYREAGAITATSDPKKGDVRAEYRGEDIVAGLSGSEQNIAVDPYPTYSFAFAIKRARVDTAAPFGQITAADQFSNSLFELRVYVFKNFNTNIATALSATTGGGEVVPKTNVPVRTFVTLISL